MGRERTVGRQGDPHRDIDTLRHQVDEAVAEIDVEHDVGKGVEKALQRRRDMHAAE
jgi:hypothetical protein